MPELPEVETIRRQVAPLVEGRTIDELVILEGSGQAVTVSHHHHAH